MQQRTLGTTGLRVSTLGFGCMGISFGYGQPRSRDEGIAIIRAAFDHGVTFFDTAEAYGPFTNEEPLGKGFLTGAIDDKTTFDPNDFRRIVPRFTEENRQANLAFVEWLKGFAERKQATPAQVALAWLLAQRPWIVPIPGTTKLHRLDENIGAAHVQLDTDDLRSIDDAAEKIPVHGARYPAPLQALVGR